MIKKIKLDDLAKKLSEGELADIRGGFAGCSGAADASGYCVPDCIDSMNCSNVDGWCMCST
jgi:hypothetical protein